MKKSLIFSLLLIALLFAAPCAMAGLSINAPSAITFPQVTIGGGDQFIGVNMDIVTVTDDTGGGWRVLLNCTDYFKIGDNSKIISVENMKLISINNLTAIAGTPATDLTAFSDMPLTTSGITMLSAPTGKGKGIYTFNPSIQLKIPAQSYIGMYLATFTITIQAGP